MSQITTHVLDAAAGRPAAGLAVVLLDGDGDVLGRGVTDADGRVAELGPERLEPGAYRLVFDTDGYFGETPHFHPVVAVDFRVAGAEHCHVPLLLSPFAYSTYRGS
ncbi:MAG: hydroxyisourate hydrolase [Microbacteriaceae bacterium]